MRKFKTILMTVLAVLVITLNGCGNGSGSHLRNQPSGFEEKYVRTELSPLIKSLPGFYPHQAWVVCRGRGLGHLKFFEDEMVLFKDQLVVFSSYPVGDITSACGPGSNGIIYLCGFDSDQGYGIWEFDCEFKTVTGFHPLGDNQIIQELTLSADQTKLFVIAWNWPRHNEYYDPGEHRPESGRVWEVDLETWEITRSVAVGKMPNSCFLTENNRLAVSTLDRFWFISGEEMSTEPGEGKRTDIIDVDTFERVTSILCGSSPYDEANRLAGWSDDGRYVGVCCALPQETDGYPGLMDSIWVIDTVLDKVSETLNVRSYGNMLFGVRHATVSSVRRDTAYVCGLSVQDMGQGLPGEGSRETVYAIDSTSGAWLATASVDFRADYVLELPDGLLVVTGELSNRIAILKPNG